MKFCGTIGKMFVELVSLVLEQSGIVLIVSNLFNIYCWYEWKNCCTAYKLMNVLFSFEVGDEPYWLHSTPNTLCKVEKQPFISILGKDDLAELYTAASYSMKNVYI